MSRIDKATPGSSGRLMELDALRGLAALAVVLFHFTARFEESIRSPAPRGHRSPSVGMAFCCSS